MILEGVVLGCTIFGIVLGSIYNIWELYIEHKKSKEHENQNILFISPTTCIS